MKNLLKLDFCDSNITSLHLTAEKLEEKIEQWNGTRLNLIFCDCWGITEKQAIGQDIGGLKLSEKPLLIDELGKLIFEGGGVRK